jgi:hypothetical protein
MVVILANIAAPRFLDWLGNYRLKTAGRELYSNMQLAKLGAIKSNANWAIVFDNSVNPGRYFVCSDNGGDGWDMPIQLGGTDTVRKEGRLLGYGSGIDFGHGHAPTAVDGGGFPLDDIGFNANVLVFDARGLCNAGYVYLQNNGNRAVAEQYAYAVGTRANGSIVLRKWFPASGNWGGAFGER